MNADLVFVYSISMFVSVSLWSTSLLTLFMYRGFIVYTYRDINMDLICILDLTLDFIE